MVGAWDTLTIDGRDRSGDHALLGLEPTGAGTAAFTLTAPLARFDGRLFGGTAIGVAVALAEAETGRTALWTTVQFIDAGTEVGDRFDCTTELLAEGRSAAQVRVTAFVGAREIFCAIGSTAHPKSGRIEATFETMPRVTAPDVSDPLLLPIPESLRDEAKRRKRNIEFLKAAPLADSTTDRPHLTIWARVPGRLATPAVMAYLADMVPMSIARAAQRAGGGTSLDNSMRFSGATADEWVLLELDPHMASGGYGHGSVLVWSPDGELLATGSQTTSLLLFD